MDPLSTRLVLAPPAWPQVLAAVAIAMLAADLAAVVLALARGGLSSAGRAATLAWLPALVVLGLVAVNWTPTGAITAIALVAVAWAVRSYGRTTSPLRPRTRALLLGLRILALLLAAVWALRPTLERTSYEDVRATLLVGIDVSGSMANPDMTEGLAPATAAQEDQAITRLDAVRRALRKHAGELKKLAENRDLRVFTFAHDAGAEAELPGRGADWDALLPAADKPTTALGDSVDEALGRYFRAGRDVAAVMIVSDGANNTSYRCTPQQLAERMSERGVPAYTIGVGRSSDDPPGAMRVLAVKDLKAEDKVEAFNKLPLAATVEAVGLAGDGGEPRDIEITCRLGDELLKSEKVRVAAAQQTIAFTHEHVPLKTGTQRLVITASLVGKAPRGLRGVQKVEKLIHVSDHGLRVLYIEGQVRYEAKYIARALAAARGLTLQRIFLIQPLGAGERPPLAEKLEDWLRWHAIILGDVPPSQFSKAQIEMLARLVSDYGKGFCMIGGRESFERGLWAGTPVAGMMPVDLGKSTGEISQDIQVSPTPDGRASELMRIGKEGQDVAAAWAALDKLPGASVLAGVKPGAEVLATTDPSDGSRPLIVRQGYGKGRSMAIAFDTTWRWVLSPNDTAEAQQRFWRQVAMYLAAPKGNVWIETDRSRYDLRRMKAEGQSVTITAGLEDASGTPVSAPRPQVELFDPQGKPRKIELTVDEATRRFRGELSAEELAPTGEKPYVLKIKADVGGKELTSQYSFEATHPDLDSRDTEANLDELKRLANKTRGRFERLDKMASVFGDLKRVSEPQKKPVPHRNDLSASLRWPAVIAILSLLCLEWALRKRRGLV